MPARSLFSAVKPWTHPLVSTSCTRSLCTRRKQLYSTRSSTPWFVDESDERASRSAPPPPLSSAGSNMRLPEPRLIPVPAEAPAPLKELHARLSTSPFLEPSTLLVTRPLEIDGGPVLPERRPSGTRRRRGGTYAGESEFDVPGGLWSWWMIAQVKEGTEGKGTIESVVRVVRKTLLERDDTALIAPNSKRRMGQGWAMVDAGDFAVHVMSRDARDRYFSGSASY